MAADRLSKVKDCGLAVSYKLTTDCLTVSLLGLIPFRRVKLGDIEYLRLASREEVPRMYYYWNWQHFRPPRAGHCPVYVVKTKRRGKKLLLKLRGGAHFRLRSAIGHSVRRGIPSDPRE